MTAILLGAAIEAARQLGGDSVAALLFQITELGGKVIFGTVIIVVGLFLARILAGLVGSSTGEAGYAQTIVKYAIIALVHRDRPDLHGAGRPDRDDGVRADPRLGRGRDGDRLRARRPRLRRAHAGANGRPARCPRPRPSRRASRRSSTTASRRWCEGQRSSPRTLRGRWQPLPEGWCEGSHGGSSARLSKHVRRHADLPSSRSGPPPLLKRGRIK